MAVTAALYAGAATGLTGTWSNLANAQGATAGNFATCAISTGGQACLVETSSFGAQAAVPAGSTVNSVTFGLRYSIRSSAETGGLGTWVSALSTQLFAGATQKATQSLTSGGFTSGLEVSYAVTGLTYADLADLRIRYGGTNAGPSGVARTFGLDWARVVVDYTPPPASASFFPFF